jgi:HAD superfamily hydrolase (TIGR01509 family)
MSIRAVVFDIGGVLLLETGRDKWPQRLGLSDEEFREDVWALQEPNLVLIDFLHSLQPQYKTATLSNDWPGAREQQNRLFDLEDQLGVDAMLYSCEEGLQKPEAAFYLLACERLQVQPEEMVFVDDTQESVDAARELGMTGILFQDTAQAMTDIQACLASRRVKSLSPLTTDDPVERRERDDIDQGARSSGREKTKVWEGHQSGNGADGDRRDDRADVQRG